MEDESDVARPYERIGVIGAGAWGTALALIAARAGRSVSLWAREPEVVEVTLVRDRTRPSCRHCAAAHGLHGRHGSCHSGRPGASGGVPAQHLRASCGGEPACPAGIPLVICAKGFERTSGKLVTEVLTRPLPASNRRSSPGRPSRTTPPAVPTALPSPPAPTLPSACRRA